MTNLTSLQAEAIRRIRQSIGLGAALPPHIDDAIATVISDTLLAVEKEVVPEEVKDFAMRHGDPNSHYYSGKVDGYDDCRAEVLKRFEGLRKPDLGKVLEHVDKQVGRAVKRLGDT